MAACLRKNQKTVSQYECALTQARHVCRLHEGHPVRPLWRKASSRDRRSVGVRTSVSSASKFKIFQKYQIQLELGKVLSSSRPRRGLSSHSQLAFTLRPECPGRLRVCRGLGLLRALRRGTACLPHGSYVVVFIENHKPAEHQTDPFNQRYNTQML